MAYVADGKHAWNVRLEGQRPASEGRPGLAKLIACELDIGADEATLIEGDTSEPAGRRLGADEAEEAAACLLTLFAAGTDQRNRVEHMFTVEARDLCATAHSDLRVGQQPIDQVARHSAFDLRASDRDSYLAAAGCEKERRLACTIPAPDDRD